MKQRFEELIFPEVIDMRTWAAICTFKNGISPFRQKKVRPLLLCDPVGKMSRHADTTSFSIMSFGFCNKMETKMNR